MKLSPMLVKIDLKSVSSKLLSFPRFSRKETVDECWQIDLLTTNRIPSRPRISPMRGPLSGRLQTPELLLLGPVSLYERGECFGTGIAFNCGKRCRTETQVRRPESTEAERVIEWL